MKETCCLCYSQSCLFRNYFSRTFTPRKTTRTWQNFESVGLRSSRSGCHQTYWNDLEFTSWKSCLWVLQRRVLFTGRHCRGKWSRKGCSISPRQNEKVGWRFMYPSIPYSIRFVGLVAVNANLILGMPNNVSVTKMTRNAHFLRKILHIWHKPKYHYFLPFINCGKHDQKQNRSEFEHFLWSQT